MKIIKETFFGKHLDLSYPYRKLVHNGWSICTNDKGLYDTLIASESNGEVIDWYECKGDAIFIDNYGNKFEVTRFSYLQLELTKIL